MFKCSNFTRIYDMYTDDLVCKPKLTESIYKIVQVPLRHRRCPRNDPATALDMTCRIHVRKECNCMQ
jgi:hypothetical protein